MSETDAPLIRSNSGSDKRRRNRRISIAVDDAEYATVEEKANSSGLTLGSFGRATLLGSPAPRAKRRPPVNAQMLGYAVAQLNRAGNNLNQLTRMLNTVQATGADDTAAAVAETRAAVASIRALVGRTDRDDRQGKHA